MARRLSYQNLVVGLALTILPADLPSALAQPAPQARPAQQSPDKPQENPVDKKGEHDNAERDHSGNDKKHDEDRGRRGFDPDMMLGMMKSPNFMLEVVKRDGGPLELLAPLMKSELRTELELTPEQAAAVDKFFADMTQRFRDDIEAHKDNAKTNWSELFDKRLQAENSAFDEFLKGLPDGKRDRLIGIFVQYRNLRALSNRVIAVEKLGMSAEDAKKLRADIDGIRWEVIRPNDEKIRREMMERGNISDHSVKKIRGKIDSRIEKLVDKKYLEQLEQLKGKKLADDLLERLDRPSGPGGGGPRGPSNRRPD